MYALINGYVFRDPERKTAKSGIDYAKASIKEGRGDETIFVSVTAFRDCADALMQARDGDAISVSSNCALMRKTANQKRLQTSWPTARKIRQTKPQDNTAAPFEDIIQ